MDQMDDPFRVDTVPEPQPIRSRSESAAKIADAVSQMHQTVYEMDKAAEDFFDPEILDDSSEMEDDSSAEENEDETAARSRSESAATIAEAVSQMHQTVYEMDKAAEDFYDAGAPAMDQIRSAPFGGDCDVTDDPVDDWGSPSSASGSDSDSGSPSNTPFSAAKTSPHLEDYAPPSAPSASPKRSSASTPKQQTADDFFETASWEGAEEEPEVRSRSESAATIAEAVSQMHQTVYEMDKAAEDFYDAGAPAMDQIRSAPFGGDCDVTDDPVDDLDFGTPTHGLRGSMNTTMGDLFEQPLTQSAPKKQGSWFRGEPHPIVKAEPRSCSGWFRGEPHPIVKAEPRSRSESAAKIMGIVTQMHQTNYEMDKAAEEFYDAGAPAVDQIRSAPFGGDCGVADEDNEDEFATPTAIY